MPRWRACYHGNDIAAVHKSGIVSPVEDENKLMFRVLSGNALENLVCVPPEALHLVLQ